MRKLSVIALISLIWMIRGALTNVRSSIALAFDPARRVRLDKVAPVSQPATMILFGAGFVGLAGFRRNKLLKK